MFYNLKKTISTKVFNYHAREILKSPAAKCDSSSSTVIVSQLCSRDLIMYLVAIKTFTQYVTPLKIIVIGDRLDKNDTEVLHRNLDNVEIINIRDINTEDFPSGGTWERLLAIVDFSNEHYVIQLDADTITLSKPEEVLQCIAENRSFTLGTGMGQKVITFQEATNLIKAHDTESQHIQVVAEMAMAEIDRSNNLKYIRGCSGFAGFSKNSQTREQLKSISKSFEDKLGIKKWHEWGSEQVSSNILIANSAQPLVLPIKKYYYFQPGMNFDQFHLVHFLGSNRFTGGEYARQASKQIEILNSQSTP